MVLVDVCPDGNELGKMAEMPQPGKQSISHKLQLQTNTITVCLPVTLLYNFLLLFSLPAFTTLIQVMLGHQGKYLRTATAGFFTSQMRSPNQHNINQHFDDQFPLDSQPPVIVILSIFMGQTVLPKG